MKRDRNSQADGPGSFGTMKRRTFIAPHAQAVALFNFQLQRYALNASLDSSPLWALTFGGCAAGLAYSQSNR
jgi:hypothetical protein